jgi:hypothetical protein
MFAVAPKVGELAKVFPNPERRKRRISSIRIQTRLKAE